VVRVLVVYETMYVLLEEVTMSDEADNVEKYALKVDKLEAALEASRAAVKSLQSEVMMLDSQRRMEHDRATMRAEESTWAWDELFKLRVTIGALKRKLEISQAEVKRLADFLFKPPQVPQPPDCCDTCGQHLNACHDRDEARCAARTMYRNINRGQWTYLAECFLMKYPWLAQEKSPPGTAGQPETGGEQETPLS
jgi:hypothetical protein